MLLPTFCSAGFDSSDEVAMLSLVFSVLGTLVNILTLLAWQRMLATVKRAAENAANRVRRMSLRIRRVSKAPKLSAHFIANGKKTRMFMTHEYNEEDTDASYSCSDSESTGFDDVITALSYPASQPATEKAAGTFKPGASRDLLNAVANWTGDSASEENLYDTPDVFHGSEAAGANGTAAPKRAQKEKKKRKKQTKDKAPASRNYTKTLTNNAGSSVLDADGALYDFPNIVHGATAEEVRINNRKVKHQQKELQKTQKQQRKIQSKQRPCHTNNGNKNAADLDALYDYPVIVYGATADDSTPTARSRTNWNVEDEIDGVTGHADKQPAKNKKKTRKKRTRRSKNLRSKNMDALYDYPNIVYGITPEEVITRNQELKKKHRQTISKGDGLVHAQHCVLLVAQG